MENFKIQNFEKANPGKRFPVYTVQDEHACADLVNVLSKKLGIEPSSDGVKMVQEIQKQAILLKNVNAESEDFDLSGVLKRENIKALERVFINWYRFDAIDAMAFQDLSKCFGDVWYPSSDDIEIFDASTNWMLCVAHNGIVKLWMNSQGER